MKFKICLLSWIAKTVNQGKKKKIIEFQWKEQKQKEQDDNYNKKEKMMKLKTWCATSSTIFQL